MTLSVDLRQPSTKALAGLATVLVFIVVGALVIPGNGPNARVETVAGQADGAGGARPLTPRAVLPDDVGDGGPLEAFVQPEAQDGTTTATAVPADQPDAPADQLGETSDGDAATAAPRPPITVDSPDQGATPAEPDQGATPDEPAPAPTTTAPPAPTTTEPPATTSPPPPPAAPAPAPAAPGTGKRTLYVDGDSGYAHNPGTEDQPFRRPIEATSIAQPGDTIYLRGGTYDTDTHGAFNFRRSGTPENWIRIAPYPGETVTLVAGGEWGSAFEVLGASYVEVSGFVMRGRDNSEHGVGVFVKDGAHDVRVMNNRISNFGGGGVSLVGASRVTIEGNEVRDNGARSHFQGSG
ncbi:MAG: right-handed parallel beta-helix repeat-containing protein, partial [Actinomycetota bacterium]